MMPSKYIIDTGYTESRKKNFAIHIPFNILVYNKNIILIR